MTSAPTAAMASTREAYGETLVALGKERTDIVVLDADLAKSTQTIKFGKVFPDRFFYVGIQEQNMMSIAGGLAHSGKTVFASSFAIFATTHAYDQIRLSIAQPKLNGKIVCTHGGITVGEDGSSAHSIEDLALMCALPTFTVVVPADVPETVQVIRTIANMDGPCYVRLSRPPTPVVHGEGFRFQLGKAEVMRPGNDVAIIACGNLMLPSLQAAETLAREGVRCRVINMATLQPIDREAIAAAARETGAIVTAEEHLAHGGLGSIVARVVTQEHPAPVEQVAIPSRYFKSATGWQLMDEAGLNTDGVTSAVRRALKRKK